MDTTYIMDIDATTPAGSIEDAQQRLQQAYDALTDLGFEIQFASVNRGKEQDPVEFFALGSTSPYRNQKAQGHELAGTGSGSR